MNLNNKLINKMLFLILFVVICALFEINYLQILNIVEMCIIGFFFAYVYYIIVENVNIKIKNTILSHILCSSIIIILIIVFTLSFAIFVKNEFVDVRDTIRIGLATMQKKFKLNLSSDISYISKYVINMLKKTTAALPLIVILPFIIIYSIIYYYDIKKTFIGTKFYRKYQKVFLKINKDMQIYIMNMIKIISILILMATIVFYAFKISSPIFVAIFYGISDLIPIFGPIASGIIIGAIILIKAPSKLVGIIIAMMIMQLIEEQVIAPKIHSDTLSFNPLLIIVTMLIFGELLGGFGIFFTIPLLITISNFYNFKKEKINY